MQQRPSEARRAEVAEAFVSAEHLGERPGKARREDLEQQTRNAGLSGVSASSRAEIKQDLLEHAQQSGE